MRIGPPPQRFAKRQILKVGALLNRDKVLKEKVGLELNLCRRVKAIRLYLSDFMINSIDILLK